MKLRICFLFIVPIYVQAIQVDIYRQYFIINFFYLVDFFFLSVNKSLNFKNFVDFNIIINNDELSLLYKYHVVSIRTFSPVVHPIWQSIFQSPPFNIFFNTFYRTFSLRKVYLKKNHLILYYRYTYLILFIKCQ